MANRVLRDYIVCGYVVWDNFKPNAPPTCLSPMLPCVTSQALLSGCSMEQEPSEDTRFVYIKRPDFDYVLRVIPVKAVSSTLFWNTARSRYCRVKLLNRAIPKPYFVTSMSSLSTMRPFLQRDLFWTRKHLRMIYPCKPVMKLCFSIFCRNKVCMGSHCTIMSFIIWRHNM